MSHTCSVITSRPSNDALNSLGSQTLSYDNFTQPYAWLVPQIYWRTNLIIIRLHLTLSPCYTAFSTLVQLPRCMKKKYIWNWKGGIPGSWLLSCHAQIFHLFFQAGLKKGKQANKQQLQQQQQKQSHLCWSLWSGPAPSPFISHDWEEQKKVAGFWTIISKIESRSLAGNIKCKKHAEHKLEQDKGIKGIYRASTWWIFTFSL